MPPRKAVEQAPEVGAPEVGEVAVVVLVQVPGLRNGLPWPERGERWSLPADEAAQYGSLGLVRPFEG